MTLDIDTLSEAELVELNHRIVARLRAMRDLRDHVGMLEFRIGDRVAFAPPGRGPVEGVLIRYNRKTVTVLGRDGMKWNVSPSLLRRVLGAREAPGGTTAAPDGHADLADPRPRLLRGP